ncbi:hypothetical protein CGC20_35955 [Leishmania donovani]|uniref:Uncharacterized protein n=1 Tax=Leishmania donovani TaxID=5661 RepID=A0A504XRG6_LEIDO|nr:hypothetical protein CGC20_35955 [Leishmania donovani]
MSDMNMDMRIHNMKYTSGLESGPFTSEGVLSTNADPAHDYEASATALGAHSTLFHALAAVEEDDDGENSNDVLLRLLNEVRAVESDGDDDEVEVIDKGSDENAAGALALRHGEEPAKPYMPPYTAVPRGGGAIIAGGFTPPPPSFAEAMATAHGTPASLLGRSVPSQECSPMLANYVPPMPAAPQETVLLRNSNGVFLLQPISKPTPPYTPPAGSTSPPAGARASSITEPLHYAPFGPAGGSPYLSATVPYSHDVGSQQPPPLKRVAAVPVKVCVDVWAC